MKNLLIRIFSAFLLLVSGCNQSAFATVTVDTATVGRDVIENLTTPEATVLVNENFRRNLGRISAAELSIDTLNALFTNNVLQMQYGGTGTDLSSGAINDLLYFSTSQTLSRISIADLKFLRSQVFTSTPVGDFTIPAGVTKVYLTMWGGGGSGSAKSSGGNGGGGGGSGASCILYPYTVTPGNPYTIVVGGGAAHATGGNDGTNGSASSFGSISVNGGSGGTGTTGGAGGTISSINASGATGGGTGAVPFVAGGSGGNGTNPGSVTGGGGGGTALASGNNGGTGAGSPADATANTGAGGAGSNGGFNSAAGGSGLVIVYY